MAIYTPQNCTPAYQLDWSYTLFWRQPPSKFQWYDELKEICERDHIRILNHQFKPPSTSQFLVSTQPQIPPVLVAQRIKGRLQYLIRSEFPRAFRRNYSIRSIGSTRREKLDRYLATQLDHHRLADKRVDELMRKYQIHHPEIDLSQPRHSLHAIFWYNLHVVISNEPGLTTINEATLQTLTEAIEWISERDGRLLSRGAIVPDHLHLALGCELEESPQDVALSYMNGLADACGGKRIYRFGYYVGTFSEFDLGVIPV